MPTQTQVLSSLHYVSWVGEPGIMTTLLDAIGPAVSAADFGAVDDDDDRVIAIVVDGDTSCSRSVTLLVTDAGRRRVSRHAERIGYAVLESRQWGDTATLWASPPVLVVQVRGVIDGHVVVAGCLS